MRGQSFYDWLEREISTEEFALVGLYEQKDKLLYQEAPALRKRYMDAVGDVEEGVLNDELEVSLLRRKVELIQIAINRREPIDIEAIEKELEKEKEEKVSAVENADLTLKELPELSEEERKTMQRQYREITTHFHPAMNKNITETQKELFEKAVEAYKNQDAEAMKLIYDLLFSPSDLSGIDIEFGQDDSQSDSREEFHEVAAELSIDYHLAKKLYSFFVPLEEDFVVLDIIESYKRQRKNVMAEIDEIRRGFPFNALTMLSSSEKINEYLAELQIRKKLCETERKELEDKIEKLIEGIDNG